MEVSSTNLNTTYDNNTKTSASSTHDSDIKFSDELNNLKGTEKEKEENKSSNEVKEKATKNSEDTKKEEEETSAKSKEKNSELNNAMNNLTDTITTLNQSEDKISVLAKDNIKFNDINKEGADLINNDFNIDNKDKLPQMLSNMNFGGDGQSFSSFMDNNSGKNEENKLLSTAKELAEESAILSTMAENIAIANKINMANPQPETEEKTITSEKGIKKIDTKTNLTKEIIVTYDTVLMNEDDVNVFLDIINGNQVNINNLSTETLNKSVNISKTLSDLLAKAMEDNKPVRIEFDNGISVIIKISKDGKLSADFLPSTQIAEAYLKENLPLLKQKFNEQNLDYNELNQRERRNSNQNQNRKKDRENE